MFEQALLPDTLRAIQLIADIPIVKEAHLAGGTALALQIGHRVSVDLDFFTRKEFDEKVLSTQLLKYPEFKQEGQSWRTVWGKIGETKFSLFYYPYKILLPFVHFERISLMSKPDIAAMKLHAVEDRGVKRDFIDLYFLAKEYSLEEMIGFYDQKYASLDDHLVSIIKSLNYFADAESDDWIPRMLLPVDWEEVKSFFDKEALRLAEKKLNL